MSDDLNDVALQRQREHELALAVGATNARAAFKERVAAMKEYSTAVVGVAYAAMFTLWGLTQTQQPPMARAIAGLSLTVSVLSFALLEIFRIGVEGFAMGRYAKAMRDPDPMKAIEGLDKFNKEVDQAALRAQLLWRTSFLTSVIFGLVGAVALLYTFVMALWVILCQR